MSALLKELKIYNFRNHRFFSIQNPQQLIIIIGKNASGKTNIIEAVQLVTMLESFRNPHWSTIVSQSFDSNKKNEQTSSRKNNFTYEEKSTIADNSNDAYEETEGISYHDETTIKASFLQNERTIEIQMDIKEGKRSYSLNNKKRNRLDLVGLVPSIIFVPDDLTLVKNASEVRRKLIDDIGQQLSTTYLNIHNDYQKTIRQRNALLKNHFYSSQNTALFESWDENLIVLGALLFTHRVRLYLRYMEKVKGFYQQMNKGERLSSRYIPSFFDEEKEKEQNRNETDGFLDTQLLELKKEEVEKKLEEKLVKVRELERIRAKSLVGPHRDDILFYINGLDARKFASQGQQRSIALALKLGQLELIREISGNQPILLLDDVMSELDENRREALIRVINGQMQTIITSTDLSCFNSSLLREAQIIELS